MTEESNSVSAGKSLSNILNSTGLPTTLRGKAQRTFFRLIAGGMGLPYFAKIRENLDTVDGRARVNAMIAVEVGRQAIADPELMERAKARFLGDIGQKQENVEAVGRLAQKAIDEAADSDVETDDATAEPNDDWMNAFAREAENASSDQLRIRLANVLTGEIRKPGSYARSTIRLIAEVEQDTLEQFKLVLHHRVGQCIVRDETWNQGDMFEIGVSLEDVGLISGSSGFTNRAMHLDGNGNGFFAGEQTGMVLQGVAGTQKQIGVWLLTRAGREVASLLPAVDERSALRRAAQLVDKSQISKIIMGRATASGANQVHVAFEETLWLSPTPE